MQNRTTQNGQGYSYIMQAFELKKLLQECDHWRVLLELTMNENILLKTKLAEILEKDFNNNLLDNVEGFQNSFIKQDQLVELLRNELSELSRIITNKLEGAVSVANDLDGRMAKMRNNMSISQRQFTKLRIEFNDFVQQNF